MFDRNSLDEEQHNELYSFFYPEHDADDERRDALDNQAQLEEQQQWQLQQENKHV